MIPLTPVSRDRSCLRGAAVSVGKATSLWMTSQCVTAHARLHASAALRTRTCAAGRTCAVTTSTGLEQMGSPRASTPARLPTTPTARIKVRITIDQARTASVITVELISIRVVFPRCCVMSDDLVSIRVVFPLC